MDLHLLAALAQFFLRALKLVVGFDEFNRALGHSLFQRSIQLTNFVLCPLALFPGPERHYSIGQVVR